VVEHNLEVIQAADWVIDMGPEAGEAGGRIVCEGPPEDLIIHAQRSREERLLQSHTGEALAAFR
jgi:excinuclease ABC subunit A